MSSSSPCSLTLFPGCHLCLDQNWCQWVGRAGRTEVGAELCESNEARSLLGTSHLLVAGLETCNGYTAVLAELPSPAQ